jgi:hypothetical protein
MAAVRLCDGRRGTTDERTLGFSVVSEICEPVGEPGSGSGSGNTSDNRKPRPTNAAAAFRGEAEATTVKSEGSS